MNEIQKAILRTLAYADIFDYPLSSSEVDRFLIAQKKIAKKDVSKELLRMSIDFKLIGADKGFYFLQGREKLISLRKNRERWSREKRKIAWRTANRLRMIPALKMVAVTGALAMKNADQEDDIDLLVVTSKNRLWLSRLLTVFLVELVAKRRRPGDKQVKDKICLNMFLDEAHLVIPQKERSLFSAHEACQLKPLWEKDGIYQKFIKENQWVKKFLPNWKPKREYFQGEAESKQGKRFGGGAIDDLETLAMKLQLSYMARRRTTEITQSGRIRFHPQNIREWVLKRYQERLRKLEVVK